MAQAVLKTTEIKKVPTLIVKKSVEDVAKEDQQGQKFYLCDEVNKRRWKKQQLNTKIRRLRQETTWQTFHNVDWTRTIIWMFHLRSTAIRLSLKI